MRIVLPWRVDELLQRGLRRAAAGRAFLPTCGGLALIGTLSAAYPVTAVVVPAVLLAPARWRAIVLWSSLGSALGATAIVVGVHHLGWANLYAHYPGLANHPDWARVMAWCERYGTWALFAVTALPLPQTPALLFFGITHPAYLPVFAATFVAKLLKYGVMAWVSRRFPERFGDGLAALAKRLLASGDKRKPPAP